MESKAMTQIQRVADMRNAGMTTAEISEALGKKESTVYSYLHKAIRRGLTKRLSCIVDEERLIVVSDVYNATYDYHAVAKAVGVGYHYATALVARARECGLADPSPSISGNTTHMKNVMPKHVLAWVRKHTEQGEEDMHTVGRMIVQLYEQTEGKK